MDITSTPTLEFIGSPGVERPINGWRVIVTNMSEGDSRKIISIVRNKMRTGRLLFIPHPLNPELFLHEVMYCTLASFNRNMIPAFDSSGDQLWQVEIEFREVED
jgi:hypothetical protein